jgi:hypothetical protein
MSTLAMGGVSTVRVVGGVLPSDVVGRALAGDLPGMAPSDYHLASGERISAAAARSWDYLLGAYASFRSTLSAQPDRVATGLTREKWLLLLLRELDYGRVPTTQGGHMTAGADGDVRQYPISHVWADVPIHLMGWGIDLDRRTEGVAGAARAPQAMVQEFLNRSDEHLWALLSNGRVLRMLRDSSALVGQAYVEFDLEAMFDGELFSDFVALYTMCHQSRLERLPGEEPVPVTNRWIERWRDNAISTGTRALQDLRRGVEQAIEVLGTGFYQNPANSELRDRLANGEISANDYQRALLRQAYRLLFWFVIEDRGLLFDPDAAEESRNRYTRYFSSTRLRQQARQSPGSRHHDLWRQVQLVQRGLASVDGLPELGLPAMGGLFDKTPLDVTDACDLANSHLLTAVRLLSTTRDKSGTRTVDFTHLGAEELGGIYEGLLELHPSLDAGTGEFRLTAGAGNERKTSGSYYTPSDLIALVLDEALDPVLDDAGHDEQALLSVTVCDPACGSGHFLVAAARRIAVRLAAVRSGESEPTPSAVQAALRDVVAQCIYGVDLNPMAAELAKVSLWLEAVEPGKPMAFLDANIRVGNALLGTTPALLAAGVPDEAFVALTGDDKKVVAALKKENKRQRQQAERGEQHDTLFGEAAESKTNRGLAAELSAITDGLTDASLSEIHQAAKRLADFEGSTQRQQAITAADAWCAAFTQPKTTETEQIAVTDEVVRSLAQGSVGSPASLALINSESVRHRFFHWHLEFPQIFDSGGTRSSQGWSGGFTVMSGNPPWERVKLQEKEYFDDVPEIAAASNASARKKLIKGLRETDPVLWDSWQRAYRAAEATSQFLRVSGRYPLTGAGDVNTYQVFAETFRDLIHPDGRCGFITPTGLATDATTAPFFADSLRTKRLVAFYDFETGPEIWRGIGHNRFRFATSVLTGSPASDDREAQLAFVLKHPRELDGERVIRISNEDLRSLNPNTGTLPLFRSRRDAEITIGIYRRHPVLIREGDSEGNPWGLSFRTMFHMTNDSYRFLSAEQLEAMGADFDGWSWVQGEQRWLPLYEAKMVNLYDARFSTYKNLPTDYEGTALPRLTDGEHADPWVEPLARYWVDQRAVAEVASEFTDLPFLLGWRDLTNQGNERTTISCLIPISAVGNTFMLASTKGAAESASLMMGVMGSLAFDFVARQKLSATHLNYFTVKQIAAPTPEVLSLTPSWLNEPLATWLIPRVLELTYTSHRMTPYARSLGYDGPPFAWNPQRRALLRAEIDAAMMHAYGLKRDEVEHVLNSFRVLRKYEERDFGEFRTKRLVLESYDRMAEAASD